MSVLMGFRIAAFHPGLTGDVVQTVIILRKQFRQRLPPVEKEPLCLLGAPDDFTSQGRQPRKKVVAAPGLEFREHIPCPGHLSGLIAVGQYVLDRHPLIQPEKILEIRFPGLRIQFVHL